MFPNTFVPNGPSEQQYAFRVPLKPQTSSKATPVPPDMFFGVALNGVPFDVAPKTFWEDKTNWGFEPLHPSVQAGTDTNNGDVIKNGAYIYRGIPKALATENFKHIGYAADGFPIFVSTDKKYTSSYKLKDGKRDNNPLSPSGFHDGKFSSDYTFVKGHGNLDACNGVTVNKKYYIYILTAEFPYTPRCWRGTADQSFTKFFAKQRQSSEGMSKKNTPSIPGKKGDAPRARLIR